MKKNTIMLFFICAALMLAVGCVTISDYNQLRPGMTKTQVIQIFGVPNSTGMENGREYYIYNRIPLNVFSDTYVDYRIVFDSNGLVIEYGQINSYHDSNVYIYNNK